jgi:hypothetical protein
MRSRVAVPPCLMFGVHVTELLESEYAAAIPPWCGERSVHDHIEMMLCWGLVSYAERGEPKPERTCVTCPIYAGSQGVDDWSESRTRSNEERG